MPIDKIKLPDNSTQDIHDKRVSGIDSAPTSGSGNLVTSGGVKLALDGYLPLTGGTMSGHVTFEGGELEPVINFDINRAVSGGGGWAYAPINIRNAGNSRLFNIGVFGGNADLAYAFLGLDDYNGEHNLRINASGLSWGSNTVWHAGNDGSGSGLDADTVDGKHNGDLTARTCGSRGAFGNENATVADCKAWLAQMFSDSALGVGDNCYVGSSFIVNWNDDTAVYDPSSVHSFIKLGGGYDGVNYGQWLLSSYGLERIGYVGRNGNQWTDIKWLANTDDINSCAKLASPNNLLHSGNEFTFIPPNFSNSLWFNYRTSDYSSSGAVTEYVFGDGAGHALASITQGQFSGNAATATKLSTARTIWGQSFDGSGDVNGNIRVFHVSDGQRLASFVNYEPNPYGMVMESVTDGTFLLQSQREADNSQTFALCLNPRGGNVGIGTTSPAVKLDVNGDIRGSRVFVSGVNSYTFFDTTNNRVGIGIAQPSYKLDVWGEIRASSLDTYLQTSEPSGGMLPNREYQLGTLSGNTTFTLAAGTSGVTNHYFWSFDTGSTAPTITWPSGITSWYGGSAPTINASKHYEVSVLNGVAVVMEV